ncbi:hypothetical protein [Sphingomonas sp.]|uniref:hypothetical protein n=1 Tax=Sphingomonas sp. TaxID=28214 RepID=UPI003B002932
MAYTVFWKKLPGKQLISSEAFDSIDDAFESADVVMIGGPGPVEITVVDEVGAVHLTKVVGAA